MRKRIVILLCMGLLLLAVTIVVLEITYPRNSSIGNMNDTPDDELHERPGYWLYCEITDTWIPDHWVFVERHGFWHSPPTPLDVADRLTEAETLIEIVTAIFIDVDVRYEGSYFDEGWEFTATEHYDKWAIFALNPEVPETGFYVYVSKNDGTVYHSFDKLVTKPETAIEIARAILNAVNLQMRWFDDWVFEVTEREDEWVVIASPPEPPEGYMTMGSEFYIYIQKSKAKILGFYRG